MRVSVYARAYQVFLWYQGENERQQVLPAGWNSSQELYVIHYELGDDKYLVKGLAMDEQLVINILVRY